MRLHDQEIGKWFERKLWKAVDPEKYPTFMDRQRIMDAAACGNSTAPKAPADFELGYQGEVYLIECKASRVKESLRSMFSAAVKDHQVDAQQRRLLSLNPGFILFYSEIINWVEFWPASMIVRARYGGKRLPKSAPYGFDLDEMTKSITPILRCFHLARQDLSEDIPGVKYD